MIWLQKISPSQFLLLHKWVRLFCGEFLYLTWRRSAHWIAIGDDVSGASGIFSTFNTSNNPRSCRVALLLENFPFFFSFSRRKVIGQHFEISSQSSFEIIEKFQLTQNSGNIRIKGRKFPLESVSASFFLREIFNEFDYFWKKKSIVSWKSMIVPTRRIKNV